MIVEERKDERVFKGVCGTRLTVWIGGRANPLNTFLLVPLDGHLSHFQIVPVLERTTGAGVTVHTD